MIAHSKKQPQHKHPKSFSGLYNPLCVLLDDIKTPIPAPPPGAGKTTIPNTAGLPPIKRNPDADAPSAYGTAHGQADDLIKTFVSTLTSQQIGYLSGLGFTSPDDVDSNRQDVQNSVLSVWDVSAAKYMKKNIADGDSTRPAILTRLQEFDSTLQTLGVPPVTPDK